MCLCVFFSLLLLFPLTNPPPPIPTLLIPQVIFDWANAEVVASIKVGHGEVHQMGFNPFLFTATDKLAELKVRVIYVYMCV